jgi:hypothetical protein
MDLSGGQRCARMLSVDLVLRYLNTLCRGILVAPFAPSWRIGLQSIPTNLRCGTETRAQVNLDCILDKL